MNQTFGVFMQSFGVALAQTRTDLSTRPNAAPTNDLGIAQSLSSDIRPLELAGLALGKLIGNRQRDLSDVDAVVFAYDNMSEISRNTGRWAREIAIWLASIGLVHAYPYGTWLTGRGNFAVAIAMAKSLIDSGVHQRIVLIFVDWHSSQAGHQDLDPRNAASCCIVSSLPETSAGYRVVDVSLNSYTDVERSKADAFLDDLEGRITRRETGFLAARSCAAARFNRSIEDFDLILPVISDQNALFVLGSRSTNHILDLYRLTQEQQCSDRASILLFSSEENCWNFVALESFNQQICSPPHASLPSKAI